MLLAATVLALSPWAVPAAATERAQPEVPSEPTTATEPEPTDLRPETPDEDELVAAGAAFTRGVQAYKEERYDDAVAEFTVAQRLAPHPDTLYNLGLAQQRAGDHVAAWRSLSALLEETTDAQEREDILAAREPSRDNVVDLRVHSLGQDVVCLDGAPMPTRSDGDYGVLTTPGAHRLDVGRTGRDLVLDGGETRVMELPPPAPPPPQWPRRGLGVLTGFAIGGSIAAGGLGLGAGLAEPPMTRLGLGVGAAAMGTLALTSTVIALVVHRRARRRVAPTPAPIVTCP